MKNNTLLAFVFSVFVLSAAAQKLNTTIDTIKKVVEKEVNKYSKKINKNKPLTNTEVINGLREALKVGTNNSAASASKVDGFYKNPLVFIPFPSEAEKVKMYAEKLGMNKQVNDFIMTMNRSAEEASKEAAPIFIDAIKSMSISDGFSILRGSDSAATRYLYDKTNADLMVKFTPVIKRAIEKVEVTKYWNPLITTYNKVPGVEKKNPNLEQYITERAIQGLFKLIAIEEKKIRTDPVARINDILKRVFGNK